MYGAAASTYGDREHIRLVRGLVAWQGEGRQGEQGMEGWPTDREDVWHVSIVVCHWKCV